MRERLWLHVRSHLRFFRRSRIVLAVGIVILGFWALAVAPGFVGATTGNQFNQLKMLAGQLSSLGWTLSAGLGLYVTSSHLRQKSVQVILTRPGSPQIWLASVFLAALIVAAATQLAGAVITLAFSVLWGVPYQIGFFYVAIDAVIDKVARQMRKYKTRLLRRHRPRKEDIRHLEEQVLHPEPVEEDEHHEHTVVRTERYPVKPMFVDEAVLQLEMSTRQFLVFMNARSSRVNVLYRRKSGDFGLIEPTLW